MAGANHAGMLPHSEGIHGPEVSTDHATDPFNVRLLQGTFVTLEQNSPEHVLSLWHNLDLPKDSSVFDWMPVPAPKTEEDFMDIFKDAKFYFIKVHPDSLNFHAHSPSARMHNKDFHTHVLGAIGYSNIKKEHRELEVGAFFAPTLQRTCAATEAHYLILRHVLEAGADSGSRPYRRVAWKCNALNIKSQRAALRLGYELEGKFRKHMIVNGRSRDSAWFSIIDDDWPKVKSALEAWLQPDNFDEYGKQIKKLEDLRAGFQQAHAGTMA